jgi:hypothetical protein
MQKEDTIRQYCILEHYCFSCFKADEQDPVKLYNGLCYLCDKEKWNAMKLYLTVEDIKKDMERAPPHWRELFLEELKGRA